MARELQRLVVSENHQNVEKSIHERENSQKTETAENLIYDRENTEKSNSTENSHDKGRTDNSYGTKKTDNSYDTENFQDTKDTEKSLSHDVTTPSITHNDVAASNDVMVPHQTPSSDGDENSVTAENSALASDPNTTKTNDINTPENKTPNLDHPTTHQERKSGKTRHVDCEGATVQILGDDDDDDEDLSDEARASRTALREASEVEKMAREFFTEEELKELLEKRQEEGEEMYKEEVDEDTRQRRTVQDILNQVFQTDRGVDDDDSWVTAPGVGLEDLQTALRERLVLPLTFPRLMALGSSPYLLLHGHPGDGLMPVLRSVSKAWGTYMYQVSALWLREAVTSGTVQDRDLIGGLFSRAFEMAPCALCVTDFDVFGHMSQYEGSEDEYTMRRLKTEFMVHLEKIRRHQDVVVFVAVTSKPWMIEPPLRKKFVYRGYCPSPIPEQRFAIFMEAIKDIPNNLSERDLRLIAEKTSLFSRADMRILAEESHAMLKLRVQEAEYFKPVFSASQASRRRNSDLSSNPPSSSHDDEENCPEEFKQHTERIISEETAQRSSQDTDDMVDSQTEETDEICTKSNTFHHEAEETEQGAEELDQETGESDQKPWQANQRAEEKSGILKTMPTKRSSPSSGETETAATKIGWIVAKQNSLNNDAKKAGNVDDVCEIGGSCDSAEKDLVHESASCDLVSESASCDLVRERASCDLVRERASCDLVRERSSCDLVRESASCDLVRETACGTPHPHSSSSLETTAAEAGSNHITHIRYTPCRADDVGSRPMTWRDVEAQSLQEPDMTCDDVLRALRHMVGEVDEDDVRRLRQWHEDFGQL
ncbi:hypothetical protein ACOMHN_041201 [Nucella lapillus]